MTEEEKFAQQKYWAERGLFLMRDLLPLMGVFSKDDTLTPKARHELGALVTAACTSAESIFLLIAYGQLWDAEILMRRVFEASLKFAYIIQKRSEFEVRLREFGGDLFYISIMKDDQKARDLLAVLKDSCADQWRPIRDMVLADHQRAELRTKYDKASRRAMETRWGFAGLLDALVNSGDPVYASISGFAFDYSRASHLIHADSVGVRMSLERDFRDERRRTAIHFAHLARLISDCFVCFQIRLGAAHRFSGISPEPFVDAVRRIETLNSELKSFYSQWLDVEYGGSSGKE